MMRQVTILLIVVSVMFTGMFAAGVWLLRVTPASIEFAAAANAKRAEIGLIEAKARYLETQVSAKIRLLKLTNLQYVQQSGVYLAALVAGRATLAAWPALVLSALVIAVVSQRERFVLRVDFSAGNVKTLVPARQAVALVERSLNVQELEAAERTLAFSDEIAHKRLSDGLAVVKAVKGIQSAAAPSAALNASDAPTVAPDLPSFADIFASRELHGELVLGYEADAPRLGRYEAVHSCLIYGLARSGKTSWLRGLIGQTILTEPDTRCDVLDPHAARQDSLAGSLPRTRHFHLIDARDPVPALQAFGNELSRRLLSQDATFPPRILLIDELNQLASEPYKPQLAGLCEAVAQRGRKVNMFLLATAQDVREKKIGDFRTSLSSAYFFKGKSSQVKAFLDDSDAAKMYRNHVTHHGIALFSAADEEPRLVSIPECKPSDLRYLEARAALPRDAGDAQSVDLSNDTPEQVDAPEVNFERVKRIETPAERGETDETGVSYSDEFLREFVQEKIAANDETLSGLAAKIGVNKGNLYRFINSTNAPSDALRSALTAFAGRFETKLEK